MCLRVLREILSLTKMSFFIRTGNTIKQNEKLMNKQNKANKRKIEGAKGKSKHKKGDDDEIESDDEDNEVPVHHEKKNLAAYDTEENYETAQEKKLRLAKLYLEEIERKEKHLRENGEVGKEVISKYLKEDFREKTSKNRRVVADTYSGYNESGILTLRCKEQHLPVTCVVVSPDNEYIYSGSKDSVIVKWSLKDGKKLKVIKGKDKGDGTKQRFGIVLCVAISSDNKYLVSGSSNKEINVWCPDTLTHIHTFSGHKGEVTGVAFQKNHHTLFSCSTDRGVKVWNLTEMAYVETLFGHQKRVTSVDALISERAITSSEDCSVHLWKIVEESQLIYNASGGVDSVKFINEGYFLSCGSDGSLCLWGVLKKRPLCTVSRAHGVDETNEQPNWICSIAALVNSDLVASGSCDGFVRLWKCCDRFKMLEPLFTIPVKGFVNALHFTHDGNYLVVGIGSEHKLGRWQVMKTVKNCVLVVPLCKSN